MTQRCAAARLGLALSCSYPSFLPNNTLCFTLNYVLSPNSGGLHQQSSLKILFSAPVSFPVLLPLPDSALDKAKQKHEVWWNFNFWWDSSSSTFPRKVAISNIMWSSSCIFVFKHILISWRLFVFCFLQEGCPRFWRKYVTNMAIPLPLHCQHLPLPDTFLALSKAKYLADLKDLRSLSPFV